MKTTNYIKGRRREYMLVKYFKDKGYLAIRTAGSHSPFDVIAVDSTNIFLCQLKPHNVSEKKELKKLKSVKIPNCFKRCIRKYLVTYKKGKTEFTFQPVDSHFERGNDYAIY